MPYGWCNMLYCFPIRVGFSDVSFRYGTGLLAGFAGDRAMEYRVSAGQGVARDFVAGRAGVLAMAVHVFVYGAFRYAFPQKSLGAGMRQLEMAFACRGAGIFGI